MIQKFNVEKNPESFASKKPYIILIIAAVIITAAIIITFYLSSKESDPLLVKPSTSSSITKESIYIFAPHDIIKLVRNVSEIQSGLPEQDKAQAILNELKKQKCIPEKLALCDCATDGNGIMYLNFSKEIYGYGAMETSQEITMIYSIVNTFISNFKNISKIQFLVEGFPVETINKVLYIYKPVGFNKDLMED